MALLKEEAYTSGLPLKQVINSRLELGLRVDKQTLKKKKFKAKTYSLGNPSLVNMDKALAVSAELEDREIVRKLEMRK